MFGNIRAGRLNGPRIDVSWIRDVIECGLSSERKHRACFKLLKAFVAAEKVVGRREASIGG